MAKPIHSKTFLLGLLGAAAGGILGYFTFFWIVKQGLYALIVPGAMLGFFAGLCAGRRSMALGLICGIAGLILGLFTEWRYAPFIADASLLYFIGHVHTLKPVTLLMVALGAFFSFRLAVNRPALED